MIIRKSMCLPSHRITAALILSFVLVRIRLTCCVGKLGRSDSVLTYTCAFYDYIGLVRDYLLASLLGEVLAEGILVFYEEFATEDITSNLDMTTIFLNKLRQTFFDLIIYHLSFLLKILTILQFRTILLKHPRIRLLVLSIQSNTINMYRIPVPNPHPIENLRHRFRTNTAILGLLHARSQGRTSSCSDEASRRETLNIDAGFHDKFVLLGGHVLPNFGLLCVDLLVLLALVVVEGLDFAFIEVDYQGVYFGCLVQECAVSASGAL